MYKYIWKPKPTKSDAVKLQQSIPYCMAYTGHTGHIPGRAFQKGSMWHPDDTGVTYTLSLGHLTPISLPEQHKY